MATPRLLWRLEGRLFVSVHAVENPTNLEWAGYVRAARDAARQGEVRVFAVSYGGAPDGAQRKELTTSLAGHPSPTVLLTSNRLVRALTTVLQSFNPKMKAVGLHDDEAAGDFLGFTAAERGRARWLRRTLEAELGLASTSAHPPPL